MDQRDRAGRGTSGIGRCLIIVAAPSSLVFEMENPCPLFGADGHRTFLPRGAEHDHRE
jgi:hypothetical protein